MLQQDQFGGQTQLQCGQAASARGQAMTGVWGSTQSTPGDIVRSPTIMAVLMCEELQRGAILLIRTALASACTLPGDSVT